MAANPSNPRGKAAFSATGMSDDARKAMNSAFDALSEWRNEMAGVAERNSSTVFDKMAAAAKAVGWPADFVDMTRQQMQQASKIQLQLMDQTMDVWESQMKQPGSPFKVPDAFKDMGAAFQNPFGNNPFANNPFANNPFASAMTGGMPGFPGFGPGFGAGGMPTFPGFDAANMPANPMQFWMQAADMWQKSWQQAFAHWMEMQEAAIKSSTTPR